MKHAICTRVITADKIDFNKGILMPFLACDFGLLCSGKTKLFVPVIRIYAITLNLIKQCLSMNNVRQVHGYLRLLQDLTYMNA